MTPPDRLVQAAAEAICTTNDANYPCNGCRVDARVALAAAFAALPVDEMRDQARKAVFFANHPGADEADWPDNTKRRRNLTDHLADAASDAWIAALGEVTP